MHVFKCISSFLFLNAVGDYLIMLGLLNTLRIGGSATDGCGTESFSESFSETVSNFRHQGFLNRYYVKKKFKK